MSTEYRFESWGRGAGIYMDGRPAPPFYGVRITHIATGYVETCDEHKSQLKNKEVALERLNARVEQFYNERDVESV